MINKVKVDQIGDIISLEMEFNTILSSLINGQIIVYEFENSLKSLIAKVKQIKPGISNIQKILNNNNGKNLMCVKYLMDEKSNLLENYQINVRFYLSQIEGLIKELQNQLVKKVRTSLTPRTLTLTLTLTLTHTHAPTHTFQLLGCALRGGGGGPTSGGAAVARASALGNG